MAMGFRERRLGCRLYMDRQSDANILKKLDRMLVDGSFPNQTELIKRGIELAYEEVYGEAEEVKASHRQEIDVKKFAEEVARALKPEMEKLMAECEARVATAETLALPELALASTHDVPQVRERVFVVAIKGDEGKEIKLPNPTHRNEVDVLTQHQKRFEGYKQCQFFVEPNGTTDELKPWVTVGDAFSDLPEVFPTADSKYKLVSLNIEYPYKTEAQNEYQKIMRTWYGKEGFGVSANAFRRNTRDFPIFERMQQGDNYIAATKIAEELFYEEAKLFGYEKDSEEYISLYNKMVPQYDKEKFENKWKKLDVTKPSHTLVAHLGKDTYSHIHPIEPRGITVREAARLQSFPDDFFFDCSMGDAFKQIGNAVPPLLAYGVAKTVLNTFEEE